AELRRIRGVVSVDSVGEGPLYIPRGTLGADFLHVLIPFGDYDSINDLLEEGAHLHGIKYNNYLAGGTTDHVSFLEVNNGLWVRLREAVRRLAARLARRPYTPPVRIPATAVGRRAVASVQAMVGWGVETRLRDQVADTCARLGLTWERERIDELEVIGDDTRLHFARRLTPLERLSKASHRVIAALQGVV